MSTSAAASETKKETKDTRRQVKVYVLNEKRSWEDRGTGHVICTFNDHLQGLALTVRSEADGATILEFKIQPEAFQKQNETQIVWSHGEDSKLTLCFTEKLGCEEIWERICQVQGKDPSVDVTQDTGYESESNGGIPENLHKVEQSSAGFILLLPSCELSKLVQINELLIFCLPKAKKREALANAIETHGYIKKLLELFKVCEDLENADSLHILYSIFKNVFMLNKIALFKILFSDKNLRDVVGVFEYDPVSTSPRPHREYLWEKAKFKEVIPITSGELKAKIHQTYRVQYIQDFILPAVSIFDENLLSTLSSFIFFNKVEIVSLIQDDENFLNELFNQLISKTATVDRKRDLAMFLKEFCSFSQTLQPQARENFFKSLTSHRILSAIGNCLKSQDNKTRLAAIEILSHTIDYDASLVGEYLLQDSIQRQADVSVDVMEHHSISTSQHVSVLQTTTGGGTIEIKPKIYYFDVIYKNHGRRLFIDTLSFDNLMITIHDKFPNADLDSFRIFYKPHDNYKIFMQNDADLINAFYSQQPEYILAVYLEDKENIPSSFLSIFKNRAIVVFDFVNNYLGYRTKLKIA